MDPYHLCRDLFTALAKDRPELAGRVVPLLEILSPRRAGPGYSTVVWDGDTFFLNGAQAKVVELLWLAREKGTHEVTQEQLVDAAGSSGRRLDHVFRGSAAWGVLIVAGSMRGTYRLSE